MTARGEAGSGMDGMGQAGTVVSHHGKQAGCGERTQEHQRDAGCACPSPAGGLWEKLRGCMLISPFTLSSLGGLALSPPFQGADA